MKLFIKISKRIFQGTLIFLELFLLFGTFYFTIMVFGATIPTGQIYEGEGVKIFVKSNGVHTDICFPVKHPAMNWTEFIPLNDYDYIGDTSYISIGWGDKGFFLDTPSWDDLTVKTALNAALLPSETAMHVAYEHTFPIPNINCREVILPENKYAELVDYTKNSFSLRNNKVQLIPQKSYWDNDNFYEAKGSYHLFQTCNSWTNDGLKVAGIKTGIKALFPDGILNHLPLPEKK